MKKAEEVINQVEVDLMEYTRFAPPWLLHLLKSTFFLPCSIHADSNKSECNQYCLDCMCHALCPSCLPSHKAHHIIQVLIHISTNSMYPIIVCRRGSARVPNKVQCRAHDYRS